MSARARANTPFSSARQNRQALWRAWWALRLLQALQRLAPRREPPQAAQLVAAPAAKGPRLAPRRSTRPLRRWRRRLPSTAAIVRPPQVAAMGGTGTTTKGRATCACAATAGPRSMAARCGLLTRPMGYAAKPFRHVVAVPRRLTTHSSRVVARWQLGTHRQLAASRGWAVMRRQQAMPRGRAATPRQQAARRGRVLAQWQQAARG
jgi:hypothetical protein